MTDKDDEIAELKRQLRDALNKSRPDNDPEAFKPFALSDFRAPLLTWQEAEKELREQIGTDYVTPPVIPNRVTQPKRWNDWVFNQVIPEDITPKEDRQLQRALEKWMEGDFKARDRFFVLLAKLGIRKTDFDWREFRDRYNALKG